MKEIKLRTPVKCDKGHLFTIPQGFFASLGFVTSPISDSL